MKKNVVIYFLLSVLQTFSQTELSDRYFNEALSHFNKQEFHLADSLFQLSNDIDPSKNTYFNIAMCKRKLSDNMGYCENLAHASRMGEEKATSQFLRTCGKIDTMFLEDMTAKGKFFLHVRYFLEDVCILSLRETWEEIDSSERNAPEFPGGPIAMMKFLRQNIKTPASFLEKGGSIKTHLQYQVLENGNINGVVIIKSSGNEECDREALRVVSIMPTWTPGYMKGVPVKCYFHLPISFTVK